MDNKMFLMVSLQVRDVYAVAHKHDIKSVMKSCSKFAEMFDYDPNAGTASMSSPVFWIREASKYQVTMKEFSCWDTPSHGCWPIK